MADMGICSSCKKKHTNRTHLCRECGQKFCTTCKTKLRRCPSCDAGSSRIAPNR